MKRGRAFYSISSSLNAAMQHWHVFQNRRRLSGSTKKSLKMAVGSILLFLLQSLRHICKTGLAACNACIAPVLRLMFINIVPPGPGAWAHERWRSS